MLVSALGWPAFSINAYYDSTLPSLLDPATGPMGGFPVTICQALSWGLNGTTLNASTNQRSDHSLKLLKGAERSYLENYFYNRRVTIAK